MPETRSFFSPKRRRREAEDLEQRLIAMEEALLRVGEQQFAIIDPVTGQPTGLGSEANGGVVDIGGGGGGLDVTAHELLNASYHVDTETAPPTRGALAVGNSTPKWAVKALGAVRSVFRSDGTDADWSTGIIDNNAKVAVKKAGSVVGTRRGVNLVEGTGITLNVTDDSGNEEVDVEVVGHARAHTLFSSSDHSDVTGTPATGDIIYRNGSSQWTKLAAATNGFFLYLASGLPAWVQLAFTHITGVITAAQHDNLASTAGATADHTGTLSANARVAVKKNGTLVATRRGVNFIEGSNVTLTVTDDSGNEEVDVTIAQTSVSAATIIGKVGGSVVVAAADTVDFNGTDFEGTESPAGELNVNLKARALLSALFNDVTAAAPTRGDIITAQGASPLWTRLAKGSSGTVLTMGADEPAWASPAHSILSSTHSDVDATPPSKSPGMLLYVDDDTLWSGLTRGGDKTILRVGAGTNQLEYASLDTILSGGATDPRIVEYTLWRRTSAAAATGAASEVPMFEAVNTGVRMPAAGKIIGIGITASGDIGSAGNNIAATVYKATSDGGAYASTAATVTLSGGAGTERSASDLSASVSFNAGDILTVYDAETGTVNAVGIVFTVYVKFDV